MSQSPVRILARVTVDETYGELLQDLLGYTGRRRARRIVFLAAIGKLTERGGVGIDIAMDQPTSPRVRKHASGAGGVNENSLRPLSTDPEDIAFLTKLKKSLT